MIGPREEDVLPPGWRYDVDEDGAFALSPVGHVYRVLPAGYEPADMAYLEALLDRSGEVPKP